MLHLPSQVPAPSADDAAEAARLVALRRYGAADMPGEQELTGLVRVAATLAGVPTATINLLEEAEQHNYVTHGFDTGSCPREDSMCVVALRERAPLHVPDASVDARFTTNPWVDGQLGSIRRYASSPLMTPDGWMIGTLCVFDEQPGAFPDPVLRALDDLAAQVMALLERRRLARRAEEAVRAKSTFLATVSHELRTPMHGVLGLLELVLQEPLPAGARTHADLARRSAGALLTLVDDVLHLSQGEAGRLTLRPRELDPAQLAHDVADALGVLAQRKGLGLVVRADPGCSVVGDPDRIRQVLVNLVGNALKFSSGGDVELTLERAVREDGEVDLRFAVRDHGEGIPAEELPTLFAPFAQGRSGHRHGGTGLGLAISMQVVEAMGGRLRVDSELGVGSTFIVDITLPRADGSAPDRPQEETAGAGLRVLVADDSEINRLVAVGLLSSMGADAEAVADGEQAVSQVADGGYDMVLLDHEMPGLDGPAAARRIRQLPPPLCAVPLYALTGRVGNADVTQCLAAGMDGVLAKPLDVDDLAAVLTRVRRR